MKNLVIIIAVVAIVGGVAIAGYSLSNKTGSGDSIDINDQVKEEGQSQIETISDSLNGLLSRSVPTKCTLSVGTGEEENEGTMNSVIYVANGKMRNNVEITKEDGSLFMKMNVISDGEWMYSWSDDESISGMKMNMAKLEELAKGTEIPEGVDDWDKNYDFKCQPWIPVDSSQLTVPVDIEFMDMTEMTTLFQDNMQEMSGNEYSEQIDICQICEMLPAEQKSECLTDNQCE